MATARAQGSGRILAVAAAFALAVGAAAAVGVVLKLLDSDAAWRFNSMKRHVGLGVLLCGIGGIGVLVAAYGLWKRAGWSRALFLITVPIVLVVLGSAYRSLWRDDIPTSVYGLLVYVPLAFALARPNQLSLLGETQQVPRAFSGATIVMLVLWALRFVGQPRSILESILGVRFGVSMLVLIDMVTLMYALGWVFAAIAPRSRPARTEKPQAER